MKIIGTGLNGLIGSKIVELLSDKFSFENISRSTGVDITNFESVNKSISSSDASIVIHLAAYTDVKLAEIERDLKEKSMAWIINVEGTKNVARACEENGKRLIHFSTDMVIGGDKMPEDGFDEDAEYNPLSWYAQTKCEAEKEIRKISTPWAIIRTAYPYRSAFEKLDFVRLFIDMMENKKSISALIDRIISPTFIDDIPKALDVLIKSESLGIYNVAGSQILSIYDCALIISKVFNLDPSLVRESTRDKFLVGRPPEPFSSALNNDKIKKLGVSMHTFEEGLSILKEQL